MRTACTLRIACLLAACVSTCRAEDTTPGWSVRIVFGTQDQEPRDWSGKVAGPPELIDRIQLEPWRFAGGQGDTLDGKAKSWKVQTRLGIAPLERQPVQGANNPPARQIPWPVGVTVMGTGPEPNRLGVTTAQGDFEIDVRSLRYGLANEPLPGVRVERTPAPVPAADRADNSPIHDDFPALLCTRSGEVWLAWISFEGSSDQVLVTRWNGSSWSQPTILSPPGDHAGIALAEGSNNRLWAVWSQQVHGDWDIYVSEWDGTRWSEPMQLTREPGPDIYPVAASCPDGTAVVAWQSFRDGQSDVYLERLGAQRRFDPGSRLRISTSPANDWMPALAVDSSGTVFVAWDSYDAGNYDVLLRRLSNNKLGPVQRVAATPLAETQPSLACDDRGHVWIAYDEGTSGWGKDYGFWWWLEKWPQGSRLYESRRFRLVCASSDPMGGDELLEISDPFESFPVALHEFSEQPIVRVDGDGLPWVFFRHRTAKSPRADGWAAAGWWELFGVRYGGDGWQEPVPFAQSMGRQSQPSAVVATQTGFTAAWVSDGRSFQQPADAIRTRLHTARIDSDRFAARDQGPLAPKPVRVRDFADLIAKNVHADEPGDVRRIREYTIPADGKKLHVYRGDLHRHTEISGDGVGDGTLTDLYRYALDAAAMDFIMVTDHGMGADRDYPWWRTQKSNDLYHVTGRFVPLYGYERSITYPWGHRNVIWADRGHRTFPTTKAKAEPAKNGAANKKATAQGPADDDTEQLYGYLRKNGGIVTLHTSASDQGTNWETGFDPQLEPLVELFQGYHTSYEGLGTPLAIDDKTAIVHGQYRPAGFVWNALDKGYRLGFQSSSDHIATHNSYACVWADSLDRRSLIDAMKKRHTYAATDNIVLDVRSAGHLMGDEFVADGPISMDVKILGTAPLAKVEIVRNKEVVYSHDAKESRNTEFHWTDMHARDRLTYYYARVQQVDRQMGWSSPIWVSPK